MSKINLTPNISNPDAIKIPDEPKVEPVDRITKLKERAKQIGLSHSNNIGEETLAKMIEDHLSGNAQEEVKEDTQDEPEKKETFAEIRMRKYKEASKLLRVRITNHNPQKKDWTGEYITIQNSIMPKLTKFIPFGEATDNGYHVEKAIVDMLKQREYIRVTKTRDSNGNEIINKKWAPEFAITILEPLTESELKSLANKQYASKATED